MLECSTCVIEGRTSFFCQGTKVSHLSANSVFKQNARGVMRETDVKRHRLSIDRIKPSTLGQQLKSVPKAGG